MTTWPVGTEDIHTTPAVIVTADDDTPLQVVAVERMVDGAVTRQRVRLTVGATGRGALNLNVTPAQARQLATAFDQLATLFGA